MLTKEQAIAPLIELWQRRDDLLEKSVIEWAGSNLSSVQANELIGIIRNSLSTPDVKVELTALAASLTQPTTIN
jgi:hypothetical protein